MLSIQIIGERKVTQIVEANRTNRTVKIFDFAQPLDGQKEYPAGERPLVYPFRIKLPSNVQNNPQMPEGTLGKVLEVAQAFSGSQSRTDWYLITRLDVPGFDVTHKLQINVA